MAAHAQTCESLTLPTGQCTCGLPVIIVGPDRDTIQRFMHTRSPRLGASIPFVAVWGTEAATLIKPNCADDFRLELLGYPVDPIAALEIQMALLRAGFSEEEVE